MARYLVTFLPGDPIPTRTKWIDDAVGPPDADVDAGTDGVAFGSTLWDGTDLWFCVDATTGSAEWRQINGGGTGGEPDLYVDLSVSGSYEIDHADGPSQDLTLTGNVALTIANAVANKPNDIRLSLRQDGTGGRTIDLSGITIAWAGGVEPAFQTDPDAVDHIGLFTPDDGTTYFGFYAGGGSAGTPATTVESETTFGISAAVGTDTEYARQDHTHGSPANPVTAAAVKALGRWEPVQFDDGSSPWPFVYVDDEIVVAWVETP